MATYTLQNEAIFARANTVHNDAMMKSENAEQKVANIVPFGLRMQPALKHLVEAEARANNRSLNAEIVSRLEASLSVTDRNQTTTGWIAKAKDASGVTRMDALEKRLFKLEATIAELRKKD